MYIIILWIDMYIKNDDNSGLLKIVLISGN